MTATILVELDIEDPSTILEDCNEVQDALENAGLMILSVKPWTRPTQPMLLPSPTQLRS